MKIETHRHCSATSWTPFLKNVRNQLMIVHGNLFMVWNKRLMLSREYLGMSEQHKSLCRYRSYDSQSDSFLSSCSFCRLEPAPLSAMMVSKSPKVDGYHDWYSLFHPHQDIKRVFRPQRDIPFAQECPSALPVWHEENRHEILDRGGTGTRYPKCLERPHRGYYFFALDPR